MLVEGGVEQSLSVISLIISVSGGRGRAEFVVGSM